MWIGKLDIRLLMTLCLIVYIGVLLHVSEHEKSSDLCCYFTSIILKIPSACVKRKKNNVSRLVFSYRFLNNRK